MVSSWARFRKERDIAALKSFHSACSVISIQAAPFALYALQQVVTTISSKCKSYVNKLEETADLVKEVDWLMNQLIRGNAAKSDPFLQEDLLSTDIDKLEGELAAHDSRLNRFGRPNIAIIDDQLAVSTVIGKILEDFAFNASMYNSIAEFIESADTQHIDLVLLDIVMPGVTPEDVFEFAGKLVEKGIKVISCSSTFTFSTRLLAVRANVSDYIVKPVNSYVLVEKIGRALGLQAETNHKLVIVDDQTSMRAIYQAMFNDTGFELSFYESAASLFESIDDLNPDMFLLDMMMPDVDGLEVARMLRQEHKFDFAPILFITADEQVASRLAAIEAGADDVIIKSASRETIIRQVATRLKRAIEVRTFVAKDPLTGVLNHGQIVELSNQLLRRTQRSKGKSSIAVVDVDLFKQVNDQHGHIMGDKVLCALGQLLSNSIRETDVVGRYGGEEFVLAFEGCSLEEAAKKVHGIRGAFASMKFYDKNKPFSVTFSAGIVELNGYDNVQAAIADGDKALYKAKADGRNRVIKFSNLSPSERR